MSTSTKHEHGDEAGHDHGQTHVHAPKSFGLAFAVWMALNVTFVVIEVAFGIIGNFTAPDGVV